MTRSIDPPTYAELLVVAIQAGRAHRVMQFKEQDGPWEEFYVIDATRHIERIECTECGDTPRVRYSTNTDADEFKTVSLVCGCLRSLSLQIAAPGFDRARGAMTSALSSVWNKLNDPEKHPDDLGAAGGFVADAHAMDVLMGIAPGASAGGEDATA